MLSRERRSVTGEGTTGRAGDRAGRPARTQTGPQPAAPGQRSPEKVVLGVAVSRPGRQTKLSSQTELPCSEGHTAEDAISQAGEKTGHRDGASSSATLTFRETSLPGPRAGTI